MPEGQGKLRSLSREQKIGFFLLLIFAIFAISLGVLQIRNNMYAPFALSNDVPASLKDQVSGVDSLRYRDTDHDGLNDFDELFVYSTSPYLADTDSDGIPDGEEVKRGSDPNCSEGKQCAGVADVGAAPEVSVTSSLGTFTSPANPDDLGLKPPNLDINSLLKDPAQLRKMLLDAGMDPALLKKVSDSDLMKLVEQQFYNLNANGATTTSAR